AAGRHDACRPDRIEHEMNAGEQVHEEIPGDAGAVVAIVAPAEQTNGLERPLWRVAQETVPVHRLRRRVGGNRVLPRAERGVAVDPRLDHVQLADDARPVQLPRLGVGDRADALAADLQDAPGLLHRGDDAEAFVDLLDHGLLDVDVLARFHRIGGDARVPVIRRADDHRLDVRPCEHLAIVARGEDLAAPDLLRAGEAAVVDVGDRRELDARDAQRAARIGRSLSARADERDAGTIARRRLRLRLQLVRAKDRWDGRHAADRRRLQEVAPRWTFHGA